MTTTNSTTPATTPFYAINSFVETRDGRASTNEQFIIKAVKFVEGVEIYTIQQFSNGKFSVASVDQLLPA